MKPSDLHSKTKPPILEQLIYSYDNVFIRETMKIGIHSQPILSLYSVAKGVNIMPQLLPRTCYHKGIGHSSITISILQ